MTDLSRGARVRRGSRRPGWVLLTALLGLAVSASAALVLTDRVQLLKLAVILALWAAIIGAFVSVLYRRQSEADQARVRDLKLVYDLQLDREISARREYELSVESQLRRELASEQRAQSADEVATLRAELHALRASLEIWFDTDFEDRRALGTPKSDAPGVDWVTSDRVDPVHQDDPNGADTDDDAAIIDVPEVGVAPEPMLNWQPTSHWPRVDSPTVPDVADDGSAVESQNGSPVEPEPPHMAPPPAADHSSRHRGAGPLSGQSVADLLARLHVQPSEGGRRRRRDN